MLTWTNRTRAPPGEKCLADDRSYHDSEPVLDLVFRAQKYYQQHGVPTKVKSCAFMTTDEVIDLDGGDAMTLPCEMIEDLSSKTDSQERLEARSVFHNAAQTLPTDTARLSYINDKAKFFRDFSTNGRGRVKTEDVSWDNFGRYPPRDSHFSRRSRCSAGFRPRRRQ